MSASMCDDLLAAEDAVPLANPQVGEGESLVVELAVGRPDRHVRRPQHPEIQQRISCRDQLFRPASAHDLADARPPWSSR